MNVVSFIVLIGSTTSIDIQCCAQRNEGDRKTDTDVEVKVVVEVVEGTKTIAWKGQNQTKQKRIKDVRSEERYVDEQFRMIKLCDIM